jgi:hypothetical protein
MVESREWVNATIGAAVTVLLALTGFSALLGGGIAGYLQRVPPKRAVRTGAFSGVLASIPILLVLGLGVVLSVMQPSAFGVTGFVELLVVLVIFPLLIGWIVGLSALGGFLGAALRRELRGESGGAENGR